VVDVFVTPPGMFFDPVVWDNQSLFLPVWLWIILVLGAIMFFSVITMVIVWFIMKSVAGYGQLGDAASAKGSPTQVFSIWKNRSFVIEPLWYYGNVLSYADPLKKMQLWFHNSEKATGVSAGKPVMITRDGFDGTVDFIAEMAYCTIAPRFNQQFGTELVQIRNPDGTPFLDDENKPVYREQEVVDSMGKPYMLTSFATIRDRVPMLKKLYPEGVAIDPYQIYALDEIYQYTPQRHDSLKKGADLVAEAVKRAKAKKGDEPGLVDRFGLIIIVAVIGFGILLGEWYILPLGH
jgi:hypothetical protein